MAAGRTQPTSPATPRTWRGPGLALALAPVIVVIVMRFLAPIQGTASARAAAGGDNQTLLVVPPVQRPTPAQVELARRMVESSNRPFGPSPVVTRKRDSEPDIDPGPVPSGQETPAPPDAPALSVTSIMTAQHQTLAVIAGKLCKVGDEVAPDWTISAIDREESVVTITHTRGHVHRLLLRPRGGR